LYVGVTALLNAISGNWALLVLALKSNDLGTKEAGEALGEMLKRNSVLKELDLSDNRNYGEAGDAAGFAQGISKGLADNGALTSLNMSANGLKGAEAGKALGDAIAANTVLKELDISGGLWRCDVEFLQSFSVGLRDNGAMTSLNLASNALGVEGAKIIAACLPKCT
jgi:Ran GTPase-activating protein (RanGAP) involved in mRNA processing and transport